MTSAVVVGDDARVVEYRRHVVALVGALGISITSRSIPSWSIWPNSCRMTFRRALRLMSASTTDHGACSILVAASTASRALESSSQVSQEATSIGLSFTVPSTSWFSHESAPASPGTSAGRWVARAQPRRSIRRLPPTRNRSAPHSFMHTHVGGSTITTPLHRRNRPVHGLRSRPGARERAATSSRPIRPISSRFGRLPRHRRPRRLT